MKVVFCTPTRATPSSPYLKALEDSLPALEKAGWEHACVYEIGNPYISAARSIMTRKALDAKADVIVYLDDDVSWGSEDLLRLIETDGDVVAGTYRFKKDTEEYMGAVLSGPNMTPLLRDDGCIRSDRVPAGFLKVTKEGIRKFMKAYPELMYGEPDNYSVDLFNHGAIDGVWYGEDYAFSKRFCEKCGPIFIVPNLNIHHHSKDTIYKGNFHNFLRRQPGGDLAIAA